MPTVTGIARASLLGVPMLLAQYDRVIHSGKGDTHDIATSHPLSYWTADPLAHDNGDLCLGCKTQSGKVVDKQDFKATIDRQRLGNLAGHEIVEIIYRINSDVPEFGTDFVWRGLLVGVKPGEFEEIYDLQMDAASVQPLKPSRIVKFANESILATYDPDSGNGGGCWEGYWWFDAAGPHPVDFDPVYKAIGEKTPKDSTFTAGCWTIDLDQHQIHTGVRRINAECHACGQLGTATASFEVVHGVAKPIKVQFDSDPQD